MIEAVELSGPLFSGDPKKQMLANIHAQMVALAESGAEEVRRGFAAGEGGRALITELGDRVADHVVGRTVARPSKGGKRWTGYGVVQVYNEGLSVAGGRSLMAAASILEGRTSTIRTATRRIGSQLRQIDLTKGFGE